MTPTVMKHATLATLLAVTSLASAQDGLPYDIASGILDWEDGWGDQIASGGDVNLDGLDDILVYDPYHFNQQNEQVGLWYMYSGKDGALLWTYEGPIPLQGWYETTGYMSAAFIGDIDGDDASEILLGLPEGSPEESGYVALVSGLTGTTAHIWLPETPYERMGTDVKAAGDVNADAIPDFAYVERRWENGLVTIRSGADLSIIKTIEVRWPRRLHNAGDINGDEHDDLAIASWCSTDCDHALLTKVYSGQLDNEVLLKLYPPQSDQSRDFGYNIAAGSDVTGDGVPDVLVRGRRGYYVYLYSGRDGKLLARFSDDNEVYSDDFGIQLAFADFNGDGTSEIVIWARSIMYLYNAAGQRLFYQEMDLRPRDLHGWIGGNEHAIGTFNYDNCMDFVSDIGSSKYVEPWGLCLTLNAGGRLLLSTECPTGGCRDPFSFDIYGDRPDRTVYLLASRQGSGCTFNEQLGMCIDLDGPLQIRGEAVTGSDRMAHIEVNWFGAADGYNWVQAIDPNHPVHGPLKSNVWRLHH